MGLQHFRGIGPHNRDTVPPADAPVCQRTGETRRAFQKLRVRVTALAVDDGRMGRNHLRSTTQKTDGRQGFEVGAVFLELRFEYGQCFNLKKKTGIKYYSLDGRQQAWNQTGRHYLGCVSVEAINCKIRSSCICVGITVDKSSGQHT